MSEQQGHQQQESPPDQVNAESIDTGTNANTAAFLEAFQHAAEQGASLDDAFSQGHLP